MQEETALVSKRARGSGWRLERGSVGRFGLLSREGVKCAPVRVAVSGAKDGASAPVVTNGVAGHSRVEA
jgi:hypothetical protein